MTDETVETQLTGVDEPGADGQEPESPAPVIQADGGSGPPQQPGPLGPVETIGVRNQTPKRLKLIFADTKPEQVIAFAPLQKRLLRANPERLRVYKELDLRGLILLEHRGQPTSGISLENIFSGLFSVAAVYFILGLALAEYLGDNQFYYWVGVPLVGILVLLGMWLVPLISTRFGWTNVRQGAGQSFSLMAAMLIGLGLTAASIYTFGDGRVLLFSPPSLPLLGRLLQLGFIGVAAMLPALLYYLFDRQQLGTLRERFERQIFDLDPTVETLAEVEAKYGSQLDELYGRDPLTSQGRLARNTRWPILVCTLVVTIGWILTLQPVSTLEAGQFPGDLLGFFTPKIAPITVGFLGTYFFAVSNILRRYTRGDLQPKAYSHITVRIFVVAIGAWIFTELFGANAYTYGFIFLSGLLPETYITAFEEFVRGKRLLAWLAPQSQEEHPLTALEGIDLYDRARLSEEGVTNIESLAHHDLIDLILATRIPVPRLVDWVDQAILYLHTSGPTDTGAENDTGGGRKPRRLLTQLNGLGIRTATDLVCVYEAAKDGGQMPALSAPFNGDAARLDLIYAALNDDEWLDFLLHWRKSRRVGELAIHLGADGTIKENSCTGVG